MKEIVQDLSFCVWLISLSMMFSMLLKMTGFSPFLRLSDIFYICEKKYIYIYIFLFIWLLQKMQKINVGEDVE